MLFVVVQQYPYLEKNYQYLKKLISFAKMQVKSGKRSLMDAFRAFDYSKIRVEFLFNQAEAQIVPLVSVFADEFGDESILKGATERIKNIMQNYTSLYLQSISPPIRDVLYYVDPQKDAYGYNFINDDSRNIRQSYALSENCTTNWHLEKSDCKNL